MIVRDHFGSWAAALSFQVPPHQRVSPSDGISRLCTPSSIAHRTLPFKCKQCDPHTPPSWPEHVWEDRGTSAGANWVGRCVTLRGQIKAKKQNKTAAWFETWDKNKWFSEIQIREQYQFAYINPKQWGQTSTAVVQEVFTVYPLTRSYSRVEMCLSKSTACKVLYN